MTGVRQRIGHMIVIGHPTNLDVLLVTIHYVGATACQSQRWY